jgi:hypothetical protein
VLSTLNGKLFFFDGELPPERPIPDLPIQRPDFKLLFGDNANVITPTVPLAETLKGFVPPQEHSCCDAHEHGAKVKVNGHANGHANGSVNGTANGHANGTATRSTIAPLHEPATVQRTLRGGNDIDITDKLTMTWVSYNPKDGANCTARTVDRLRHARQAGDPHRPGSAGPHAPVCSRTATYPPGTVHDRRAEAR